MAAKERLTPVVEAEEDVYRHTYGDSEAGPLWCYGSTCIVRVGEDLFVSGYEAIEGVSPYNNVRWKLFWRGPDGWECVQEDRQDRTREPSPLVGFPDGRLFLSINPTLALPSERWGPAQPRIVKFRTREPRAPFEVLLPEWGEKPPFTQHSYRAFSADADHCELLLMNILDTHKHESYYWSLMGSDERWMAHGQLEFPWGGEYEEPQPIRLCYPEVVLADRAVYFLGVSDIVEPVKAWKEARFGVTQRRWDYDFRRLFYSYTSDIVNAPFGEWVEVASREKTSGHISNLDLWVAPDGDVHLLWLDRTCDPRIREWFFADVPLVISLEHAVVRNGQVVSRDTIAQGGEGVSDAFPIWGRFHITPDNRLFAFYSMGCQELPPGHKSLPDPQGLENWLVELLPGGTHRAPVRVGLAQPLGRSFMTATPRGGSLPSNELELLGFGADPHVLRYVRVRV
jgi:hypothetical protein